LIAFNYDDILYSLSDVLPAKLSLPRKQILHGAEVSRIIRGLQGKAPLSGQNKAYCLTDENVEAVINVIDEMNYKMRRTKSFKSPNFDGNGWRLLRKENGRMVPLSSDYHGAVKATLESLEGATHQPHVKNHMEKVQRVSFLDKWVFGELLEKVVPFKARLLLHQDADAEFSGSKSSMLVNPLRRYCTEMVRTVLVDEPATQRALASRLKVAEHLAEAAKFKAEAEKHKAEAENRNANVMGQLVDNILGQNAALVKDQGTISAIKDVKSFLAKKVDDANETLTQGQQQNLARELKTPSKANHTAMSLLDVTTSPAPTHRLGFQTPVRVHVPDKEPNFVSARFCVTFICFLRYIPHT
jgi:hypothetical protein